jgi:hypothetical protein
MPLTEQKTKDILTSGTLLIHLGTVDEKGHKSFFPVLIKIDTLIEDIRNYTHIQG